MLNQNYHMFKDNRGGTHIVRYTDPNDKGLLNRKRRLIALFYLSNDEGIAAFNAVKDAIAKAGGSLYDENYKRYHAGSLSQLIDTE